LEECDETSIFWITIVVLVLVVVVVVVVVAAARFVQL
jgi:hypothetical protein